MRLRCLCAPASIALAVLLILSANESAAAQYADPPSTAPTFWISGGVGTGSAGRSSRLIALVGSAWLAKGLLVGGVRKAEVAPYEYGDKSDDVAILIGVRTPPTFVDVIGTFGYSRTSTRCAFLPCAPGYSSDPSGALAYSVQGRLAYRVIGIGVELFGAKGVR